MKTCKKIFLASGIAAASLFAAGCSAGGASDVPGVEYTEIRGEVVEPDVTGADIELLNIENPVNYSYGDDEYEMVFKLSDGVWINVMDSMAPINQEKFQAMADNFLKLRAVEKVESPGALGEYGLNDPEYTIYITDSDKNEINISIGNQAGDGTYYLTMDESSVYTIKPEAVESMVFDYDSLVVRDSLDITVAAEDIKSASFTSGKKTEKFKTSDTERMTEIAEALSRLKPENFVSYYAKAQELESAELTEDQRIIFNAQLNIDGETRSLTLYIGGYTDVEQEYRYMQLAGSNMIAVVESEILESLVEIPES